MSTKILRLMFSLSALLIFLAGCTITTPPPFQVDMPEQGIAKISRTDAVLDIRQDEIYANIAHSKLAAAAGAGLLFAVNNPTQDHPATEKTEEAITPVKNALLSYNVNQKFKNGLQKKLTQIDWLKFNSLSSAATKEFTENITKREKLPGNMVLSIKTSYYLTPNFRTLVLESVVTGYPNDQYLKKIAEDINANTEGTILFRKKYTARSHQTIPSGKSLSEAASIWANNDGEKILGAMDGTIKNLLSAITLGLRTEGTPKASITVTTK